jgi:hypothetical protein
MSSPKTGRRYALSVKQRDAENIFQMFQAAGQGRLGHPKRHGCPAEMSVGRESLYQFELTNGVHDTFQLSEVTTNGIGQC